jgi:predicted Zn-dependent protease
MSDEDVYFQAENALRRNDSAGAERVLLQQWPDISSAPGDTLHLMGVVRLAQLKGAEAADFLRAAVRADPDSLRHHILLGHILAADEDLAGATDAYAAAVRVDAKWPGLMMSYARAAYRAGRYAEAEAAARQLTANAPTAGAWDTLSCVLREQGKAKDAIAAAEQALRIDPRHAGAQHSYAAALLAGGRAPDALRALDTLAAQNVHGPTVAITRARVLEKLGRRGEADAAYAQAARLWSADPAVRKALDSRR